MIRADGLKGDNTNGFFVSYFERKRIAGTDRSGSASAYKMPTIEDLKVYGNQFDVAPTKSTASSKPKGDAKNKGKNKSTDDNKKGKKRKAGDEASGVTASGEGKGEGAGDAKRAKKALKKLAWKKKQMEQRAKRLEKKKQGAPK